MRRIFIALSISSLFMSMNPLPSDAVAGIPPASRYKGYTRSAYAAANQYPAIAQSLFCYCGCDQEAHHKKLIDCFRDEHAVSCGICQDEMVRAAGYKKQGMSMTAIAKQIDAEFKSAYPYSNPSTALKTYQQLHKH